MVPAPSRYMFLMPIPAGICKEKMLLLEPWLVPDIEVVPGYLPSHLQNSSCRSDSTMTPPLTREDEIRMINTREPMRDDHGSLVNMPLSRPFLDLLLRLTV